MMQPKQHRRASGSSESAGSRAKAQRRKGKALGDLAALRELPAILLLVAATGLAPRAHAEEEDEDEPIFRLSLPTKEDREAWREPGFRVQLGYAYGELFGIDGVPKGTTHSALVRVGARLSSDWSLYGAFRYAVLSGAHPGLRYTGTVEPTFDLIDGLRLTLGLGVGGFVIPEDEDPVLPEEGIVATYTYEDTSTVLGACSGAGVVAIARLEYAFVIGPLFSTGPALSTDASWTGCRQVIDRLEPDTGRPVALEQYWHHHEVTLAWMLSWR